MSSRYSSFVLVSLKQQTACSERGVNKVFFTRNFRRKGLLVVGTAHMIEPNRALCCSATPHLGSPIVGRLLRGQVFPVLDACLVSCIPSCGGLEAGEDCMVAGLGTSGLGESDKLHAMPVARLCGKTAKRNLCYFTHNRRVHLRVCTDEGWVTLNGLIERVDECEVAYERPVLYEIVGTFVLR